MSIKPTTSTPTTDTYASNIGLSDLSLPHPHTVAIREDVRAETTALSGNDALLLEHPELSKYFWKDNRWFVSDQRFRDFLTSFNIPPLPVNPNPPKADIFEITRPDYNQNFLTHSLHNAFKLVTPSASIDPQSVIDSLSYDLSESFGFLATELVQREEPPIENREHSSVINGCEIFLYRLAGTNTAIIDRSTTPEFTTREALESARDGVLRHTDKVAQRTRAAKLSATGVLNPRYQDLRLINPPSHVVTCNDIDLNSLPEASDIIETIKKAPGSRHLWIIENDTQGCVIVHDTDKLYVKTANPIIAKDAAIAAKITGFSTQSTLKEQEKYLRIFLKLFRTEQNFAMTFLAEKEPQSIDTKSLAAEIQSHETPLYIKGTRSSGGQFVVRHRRGPTGESILESDSSEFGRSLAQTIESVKKYQIMPRFMQDTFLPKFQCKCSSTGMLQKILKEIETPILEEEIPVARYTTKVGREKCEFRAIFQGIESPQLVATYAKASLKDIAANISIAGRGRHTVQVIRGIMQQNLSGTLEQAEINTKAAQTLKRFEETVGNFARQFTAELTDPTKLQDFAVDTVPVWNEQTQNIDFYLLEVQYSYGYTGLAAVDPEASSRVTMFKNTLRDAKRKLASIARIQQFFSDLN